MIIGIRDATINDAQILFDWANDPVTRQNSFNSRTIDWHDHIQWLKKRLIDQVSKTYILHIDRKPIGVVRVDVNETAIISLTVESDHRGMGLGAEILKIACNTYWGNNTGEILAYIKKDNIASQHVFEKAGFTFLKDDIFNGFEYLILKAERNGKQ